MRALADNEAPEAFAVVAVSVGGRLLLRQFVPPAQLITNSRKVLTPNLPMIKNAVIIATLAYTHAPSRSSL